MTVMTAGTVSRAERPVRIIRPQPGPQEVFLSSPADIVVYGGAAGGGKTYGLLLEPLRHINNGAFRAVVFRRTFPQIISPGGLYDQSMRLYPLANGNPTRPSSGVTWGFESGATVRFAHLQHETTVLDWQGSEIALIGFDELTHFTEYQFWYLLSRNRSTCGVRPYIRATTNPDASSWVRKLIDWWIDPETGFPIPERAGVLRWFVRINGVLEWADSAEVLMKTFPGSEPKSLTFIPARLQDNPILMREDPGYLANLMALPLVERERLLGGNWNIMPSGGKVFNRNWFRIVTAAEVPPGGVECRYWDFAGTAKELKGNDPDSTASVLLRLVGETYYVLDVTNDQVGPGETEALVQRTARQDLERLRAQPQYTRYMVRWEEEPGSASKRDTRRLVKLLDGFDAGGVRVHRDKLARAMDVAAQAEHGFVMVLQADWNDAFLTQLHHQPDWPHDDMMDALSGAHRALSEPGPTRWQAKVKGR